MSNKLRLSLLTLLFFVGCSWRTEAIVHDTSKIKHFQNFVCAQNVLHYYADLKKGEYKDMYAMELPSFHYFYDYSLYRGYYSGFKKFDTIDIVGVKKINDNIYQVTVKFYKKDRPLFTIKEKWVQMDGKCYHYLYDPFIFNK